MIASTSLRSSTHDHFEFLSRHQSHNFAESNWATATITLRGTPVAPFVCRISISQKTNRCFRTFRTYTKENSLHTRATSFEANADGADLADDVAVCGGSDSNPARVDETDASDPAEPDNFGESDANNNPARANGAVGHGSGPRQTGWHALDPIWQVGPEWYERLTVVGVLSLQAESILSPAANILAI